MPFYDTIMNTGIRLQNSLKRSHEPKPVNPYRQKEDAFYFVKKEK